MVVNHVTMDSHECEFVIFSNIEIKMNQAQNLS
jgi:hypothetical protein